MDGLSIAASLSALVTVAFDLLTYVSSVKEGGEERKKLSNMLMTLCMVLQELQKQVAVDLNSEDQSWAERLKILQQPGSVFSMIDEELHSLQDKLQSKTGARKLLQSLRWPLDKADVERAIHQIYNLHQMLIGVLGQANIALSQAIRNAGAAVKDLVVEDELKSFLDWISPLNFLQRQQLIFKEVRTGTGKWFLNDSRYQQWERDIGSVLWCPGIPGAGKSFLSSIMIDRLQTLQEANADQKFIVLMIYFAFDDANSQSLDLILGSLLKQVLQYRLELPQELRADFRKHRNNSTRPLRDELVSSLKKALGPFERIYVVVDALDELLEEKKRRELIECVSDLNEKLNLIVTSRPIQNIRRIFSSVDITCDGCQDPSCLPPSSSNNLNEAREQKRFDYFYHCVDCEDTFSFDLCQVCYDKAQKEDLQSYVEWRIEGHDILKRCVDKKTDLRQEILQRVIESAQGMFLLARFHMDSLAAKLTPKAVVKALETLPTETDTTYEKAMQRINDQGPDRCEKAKLFLMWVAYTYRPLNVREIEHATMLLLDDTEIDTDEIISAKELASLCAGLVIIDKMENVRLCHYTVENYFKKVHGQVFVDTDTLLARTCLTYLLLDEFGLGRCADRDFEQRSRTYPFLGYASSNWGLHAAKATDQIVEERVLALLKSAPHRDAAAQAFWYLDTAMDKNWDAKSGATGLHLASYFGLANAVESLLVDNADVNAQDSLRTTPLIYAALRGHEAIVEKLLNARASPSMICSRGGNALHWAVREEFSGIVRLLLARKELDVNVRHSGWRHHSSLTLAAIFGHLAIVKMLLGREDLKVNDLGAGCTALHFAVLYERAEVVKLLLTDPRIDVEARNQDGWPALIMAARNGYTEIAEMLLDRGANIEQSDTKLDGGGTAILRAIDDNQLAMVKLLYNRGANWDCKDKYNRSLIHGAAINNRSQILRWLLSTQPGFNINLQDTNGKTALHDAACHGYDNCIVVLLEFKARTDISDRAGNTPLRAAKEHNNMSSFELIKAAREKEMKPLQRSGTLVEVIEMPLWAAAFIGDTARVKMLIEKAMLSPRSKLLDEKDDEFKHTAINAAVVRGHLDIVNMLIAAGADVNLPDRLGRTPLLRCAIHDRYSIAESLLAAHADIDVQDQWGMSAISYAQSNDLAAMVILLVEHGARIKEQEQDVHRLLSVAAALGNDVAVKRLLDMGADSQRKNDDGMTLLLLARKGGHEKTVQLLSDWETREK